MSVRVAFLLLFCYRIAVIQKGKFHQIIVKVGQRLPHSLKINLSVTSARIHRNSQTTFVFTIENFSI